MQGMLYHGRAVLRYLHIILLSFLFSLVFLMLALFSNIGFIIMSIGLFIVSYYFVYISLPGDLLIMDKGLFLKKKFHRIRKIFDIDKINELNELVYEYKPSSFKMLFGLFSSFNFLSIYNDPISCVLEISDINLVTYRVYSYQTINYMEIKNRLETIVAINNKFESFIQ